MMKQKDISKNLHSGGFEPWYTYAFWKTTIRLVYLSDIVNATENITRGKWGHEEMPGFADALEKVLIPF